MCGNVVWCVTALFLGVGFFSFSSAHSLSLRFWDSWGISCKAMVTQLRKQFNLVSFWPVLLLIDRLCCCVGPLLTHLNALLVGYIFFTFVGD